MLSYDSENTRAAYMSDLRDFFDWAAGRGLDPITTSRGAVEAYMRNLSASHLATATSKRRVATLSGFFDYAVDEGLIERSPVVRVRRPTVDDSTTILGLNQDEARRLLTTARRSGRRDHALVTLLLLNGLRISEALRANVHDLGEQRGHHTLRIVGKGDKPALVPLAPLAWDSLSTYLEERSDGPLFTTKSGRRLDRTAAAKTVASLAKRAGITKRVSPHSLRHTAVTLALDAGVSLRDVQDFARHADPRTTRRYDHARNNLDRHASYELSRLLSEQQPVTPSAPLRPPIRTHPLENLVR